MEHGSDSIRINRTSKEVREFQRQLQVTLQPFEQAREWADLSACLTKLQKVICKAWDLRAANEEERKKNSLLLKLDENVKRLVSRRLAQSLHPSLPSGVHLKTLEIYDEIFTQIGTEGLVRDMAMFSNGLFPFVQNAALNVKVTAVTLFEKHYIPLRVRLQPCISGLIVALLPCIEEEKSQIYDRVCLVLQRLAKECVGERAFCYALWLTLLKTPRVRLPAIHCWWLLVESEVKSRMTKSALNVELAKRAAAAAAAAAESRRENGEDDGNLSEDAVVWSLDNLPDFIIDQYVPGRGALILQALEATFEDSNYLVKRAALDTLLRFLPMKSNVFSPESKVQLVRAVLRLLNKHDWSLTRRIVQFLTASGGADDDQDALLYFSKHTRSHVTWAFREDFAVCDGEVNVIAFKTLINLLHELELVAESVMQDLAIPALIYIKEKRANHATSEVAIEEGKKLFDPQTVDPVWVWRSLQQLWREQSLSEHPGSCMQALTLNAIYMDELLENKGTMLSSLYSLLALALQSFPLVAPNPEALPRLKDVLVFSSNLLDRVATARTSVLKKGAEENSGDDDELEKDDVSENNDEEKTHEALWDAVHGFLEFFVKTVRLLDGSELDRNMLQAYEGMARVLTQLNALLQLTTQPSTPTTPGSPNTPTDGIPPWIEAVVHVTQSSNPSLTCSVVRTFVQVLGGPINDRIRTYLMGEPVCNVTEHLWYMMHHDVAADVMIVQLLLDLHDVCVDYHIPHAVSDVLESLVGAESEQKLDAVSRYATLWRNAHISDHRTTLTDSGRERSEIFPGVMKQVLDCLNVPDPSLRHVARSWITVAMSDLPHLVDPLFSELILFAGICERSFVGAAADGSDVEYDAKKVLAIFEKLHGLLETDQQLFIEHVQSYHPSLKLSRLLTRSDEVITWDYVDLTVKVCEHLITLQTRNSEFSAQHHAVRAAACEYLKRFLSPLPPARAKRVACELADSVVDFLRYCIDHDDDVMQVQLLSLLRVMLVLSHTELQDPFSTTAGSARIRGGGDDKTGPVYRMRGIEEAGGMQSGTSLGDRIGTAATHPQGHGISGSDGEYAAIVGNFTGDSPAIIGTVHDNEEHVPLAYSPKLVPILLQGLLHVNKQSPAEKKSLGTESSIVHYIEFVVFVLKYVPSDKMTGFFVSVVSQTIYTFVQKIHFYTQNANVELFQLCTLHFLRGIRGVIHLCLGRCEEVPKNITSGFFTWGSAPPPEPPETASSKAVRDVLLDVIPALLTVCVDTVVAVEQRKRKAGVFIDGLLSTREMIVAQMVSVLDSIFYRFPQVFMESVMGIWQGNINSISPQRKLRPLMELLAQIDSASAKRVLQCTFVLLDNVLQGLTSPWRNDNFMLPTNSSSQGGKTMPRTMNSTHNLLVGGACSSSDQVSSSRASPGFRESVLFHFVYSFLSSTTADECFQNAVLIYNIINVTVQHSKEPLSPLWCLALLGTFDKVIGKNDASKGKHTVDPFKNCSSVKTANVKKTLQKLIAHVIGLARKAIDITKHSCDLDVPLPPHVAVADQMVHDDYATNDVETVLANSALRMLTVYFASLKGAQRTVVNESLVEGFIQQLPALLPILHNHSEQTLIQRYHVLSSLCHLPFDVFPTTLKVLQRPILVVLNAADFFKTDTRSLRCWRTLISQVVIGEHLQSLLPLPKWGGFFSTAAQQDAAKSLYLKRLSFIIFSCPKDTFATEVRWCTDTIFSCLQTSESHGVTVEVFHCIRVLLFRNSPHYLASSWPLILIELIKVMSDPYLLNTPTGRACILAALKLVDMAGILDLEEFALHQWMFQVTDAVNKDDKNPAGSTQQAVAQYRPITIALKEGTLQELGGIENLKLNDTLHCARSHIMTTSTKLEQLYHACDILNDNSIANILSRQQLNNQTRLEMIEIDFLEHLQSAPLDSNVLDGFKCASNLESLYPQHVGFDAQCLDSHPQQQHVESGLYRGESGI